MLRRSLERIIQLYTDKSHFVYELLQNAEDAGATGIRFVQYSDRLEVMHDGKSFTTENLQGLCDIGQSDKVNDLNQIGEFGVGFKSVFGICETVRLYSSPRKKELAENCHPFAVEIKDFTKPVDILAVDCDALEALPSLGICVDVDGHTFQSCGSHAGHRLEVEGLPLADDEFATGRLHYIQVVVEAVGLEGIQALDGAGFVLAGVGCIVKGHGQSGVLGGIVAGHIAYPAHIGAGDVGRIGVLGIGAAQEEVGFGGFLRLLKGLQGIRHRLAGEVLAIAQVYLSHALRLCAVEVYE